MQEILLIAVPLVVLPVVMVFAFAGCGLDESGLAPSPTYDAEIEGEASLVSYWRLGEAVGATTAKDTKDGNDGAYEGAVTLAVTGLIDGDLNTAVSFDGVSGQVEVSSASALNPPSLSDPSNKFSIEAWASLDEPPGTDRAVISSVDAGAHTGYAIVAGSSGHWEAWVGDGSAWHKLDSGVNVKQGAATQLVLTFDSSTGVLTLWVEGPRDNPLTLTVSGFTRNSTQSFFIGGPVSGPGGAQRFKGVIDEVAVYNDVLSQTQVGLHFAANGWSVAADPPLAVTGPTTSVGPTSATVTGTVNAKGQSTSFHFDYGPTTVYGQSAPMPEGSAGSGTTDHAQTEAILGLVPNTTYHYRFVAHNSDGVRDGADQVFATTSNTSYRDGVLTTPGLVSYWRLGETSGTMAKDSGPKMNPGTYVGSPTLGSPGVLAPFGDPDSAVVFNGSSQYVSIPLPTHPLQSDFSVELWFKAAGGGGGIGTAEWWQGGGLFDQDSPGPANDFGTSLSAGGHVLAGTGNPDLTLSSPATYLDGNWHQVVFTRQQSSGARVLYVDGHQVASGATSNLGLLNAPPSAAIGRVNSGTPFFSGSIDEVSIYNLVLPAATVLFHYNVATTL